MEYRKFDREKLSWAHKSKLPTILSALLIPKDFEYIDEIEEYLLPDDSPEKRKSLEEIRADFEAKIDKLITQRIGISRHYLERGDAAFERLKEKQNRNFRNLKLYGTTDILGACTKSNLIKLSFENGSLTQAKSGLELKPRNWLAKQILQLLLDMGPT